MDELMQRKLEELKKLADGYDLDKVSIQTGLNVRAILSGEGRVFFQDVFDLEKYFRGPHWPPSIDDLNRNGELDD